MAESFDPEDNFPDPVQVEDVLDLHGFFPEQISEVLDAFLEQALDRQYDRVKIIHGKGKSRLKWEVLEVLKRNPAVISFSDAPPDSGHWGATIAEIRLPDRNRE